MAQPSPRRRAAAPRGDPGRRWSRRCRRATRRGRPRRCCRPTARRRHSARARSGRRARAARSRLARAVRTRSKSTYCARTAQRRRSRRSISSLKTPAEIAMTSRLATSPVIIAWSAQNALSRTSEVTAPATSSNAIAAPARVWRRSSSDDSVRLGRWVRSVTDAEHKAARTRLRSVRDGVRCMLRVEGCRAAREERAHDEGKERQASSPDLGRRARHARRGDRDDRSGRGRREAARAARRHLPRRSRAATRRSRPP